MKRGWGNPPPVVLVAGTETYLRDREVQRAIRAAYQKGREVIFAWGDEPDPEVVDAFTAASTFGGEVLIVANGGKISPDLVKEQTDNPISGVSLLLLIRGAAKEKSAVVSLVHGAYRLIFSRPTSRGEKNKAAQLFARSEAARLMGSKTALPPKLASSLVGACGSDLGVIAQEIAKASALARFRGDVEIGVAHLRATIRPSSSVDIGPLANALSMRNGSRVADALYRLRVNSPSDPPVMLLLRGRGGPADLAFRWLQIALLLKEGAAAAEIASRLGIPRWLLEKQDIPAARRWGVSRLRILLSQLAQVEDGFLRGIPAPWVALETALFAGCADTFTDPFLPSATAVSVAT